MATVRTYLSLIKFSHTIFAMPFALIGFFLGVKDWDYSEDQWNLNKTIGWESTTGEQMPVRDLIVKLVLVILCMVFARSAAMAFNRYLDRHIDARNPRTLAREIPSGAVSAGKALNFTIISCVLFMATCFLVNRLCFFLSPIALVIILGYSYTKRFTALCHLILGLGLSLAPIGAYLAVTGSFALLPILFSIAVLFWVSGFDIIYALQDEEFDRSQQLFSIPASIGKAKALHVSELLHVMSIIAIIYAGFYNEFGWLYWIGVAVFAGMLIYQHAIVKPHDLKRVNLAFMTANGIASVVFAIFVITDLFVFS